MRPAADGVAEQAGHPESFGGNLRRLRIDAGLTQEALAERSGISVKAISALENGHRTRPRRDTVAMLASALGLDAAARDALASTVRGLGPRLTPVRTRPLPPAPSVGIPPDPIAHFAGRGRELASLRGQLLRSGRTVVHGLGGVGKTQLVVRYLHAWRVEYPDGMYWLRGDREASLVGDLASLVWRLGLPERDERRQEFQIEATLRWLRANPRWLVVVDNLEPEVRDAAAKWLPPGLPGHVVVTSRVPVSSSRLHLEPLPLPTATRFLLARTRQADGQAARAVAETLGCLPLALEQVAAFVEASGRDLAGVAELLKARLVELMDEGAPEDHPQPLATTWRLSFDEVERHHPAAAALLHLCAFFAPDDIPIAPLQAHARKLTGGLRRALADDLEVDRMVAALRRYSLLERRADGLRVHRLVQGVVRTSMTDPARDAWLAGAIRLLASAFPDAADEHPECLPLCARLLPHAQVVDELAGELPVEPRALGQLMNRVGVYLSALGKYALARTSYERALTIRVQVFGPDHLDTAESLNDLAVLLEKQGDLAAARRLHERTLVIRRRMLGPQHPVTAGSLNNLAMLLRAQGELASARELLEQAVAIGERTLGRGHPRTVLVRDNMGWVLQDMGDLSAARPLVESVLVTRKRILGPDHPDVAVSLHSLGRLLWRLGELTPAERYLRRSLVTFERSLGPDHPNAARTLHFLALVRRDQGRLASAQAHLRRARDLLESAVGSRHQWTRESSRALDEVTASLASRPPGVSPIRP